MQAARVVLTLTQRVLEREFPATDATRVIQEIETQMERRCTSLLGRGKRKGEACDRRCPGEQYCRVHRSLTEGAECTHVFRTGPHRNEKCTRRVKDDSSEGLCSNHRKRLKRSASTSRAAATGVEIAPEPVLEQLPTRLIPFSDDEEQVPVPSEPEPYTEPEAELEDVPTRTQLETIPEVDSEPEEEPENDAAFVPRYSQALQAQIDDPSVPRLSAYPEEGSDCDSDLDTSDLTEMYNNARSWGCQYWVKEVRFFCTERTVVDDQFCVKHKRFAGKIPYKLGPHNYPLLEVDPVYCKIHNLTGQYWYPRLLLAAKPTVNGLVVIGRLLGQRWIQALGRREIKRCHNNGLLYKALPQEVVHYNYHIPDIDTIPAVGFTSYDQIRKERPRLYIKYWKIWNRHILDRKQFYQRHQHVRNADEWRKEHTCPLPDWTVFQQEYRLRGLTNAVIPPPTLEQVQDPAFDPWVYCEMNLQADEASAPHFPPYYLDYPDPYAMRNTTDQPRLQWTEEPVHVHTPRRIKHYNRNPQAWLERINTGDNEWMQIIF